MIFERPPVGERVLCVVTALDDLSLEADEWNEQGIELAELVDSLSLVTLETLFFKVRQIRRSTYLGSGQLQAIHDKRLSMGADLVVVSIDLSASQRRNLETALDCKVLTRTEIILMVFSERARSHEGMLQVELAELQHSATRVVSGWEHLDRQKGGIGLRGAGETQAEADRRQIAARIKRVREDLGKVANRRASGRRKRTRAGVATAALVGYTNSGKSTLFNALTGSQLSTRDRAFETLDPTLRRLELPGREHAVLVDTVGFVRELPKSLVAAFRATLEEATQADLLILVTDAGARDRLQRRESVLKVLQDIGAADIPRIEVANKIDLVENSGKSLGKGLSSVSALKGTGIDQLRRDIASSLGMGDIRVLEIAPEAAGVRSELYRLGAVIRESSDQEGNMRVTARLSPSRLQTLLKRPGVALG